MLPSDTPFLDTCPCLVGVTFRPITVVYLVMLLLSVGVSCPAHRSFPRRTAARTVREWRIGADALAVSGLKDPLIF